MSMTLQMSVYTHFLEAREKNLAFFEDNYMKFEKEHFCPSFSIILYVHTVLLAEFGY